MPKKKPPEKGEKPQIERFVDAARNVGVDAGGKGFDESFAKVMKVKKTRITRKKD